MTIEPTTITAGDSVAWKKSLADYAANASWTLSYRLRGPNNYDISGGVITASGTDFVVAIPAATTAAYTPGDYTLFGWVTKGSDRYQVVEVPIVIKPNNQTQTGSFDGRTHAKKALAAIEEVLEGNASREEIAYTINFAGRDRNLMFCPKAELIRMRNYYLAEVQRETVAERIKQGKGGGGKILVRFK